MTQTFQLSDLSGKNNNPAVGFSWRTDVPGQPACVHGERPKSRPVSPVTGGTPTGGTSALSSSWKTASVIHFRKTQALHVESTPSERSFHVELLTCPFRSTPIYTSPMEGFSGLSPTWPRRPPRGRCSSRWRPLAWLIQNENRSSPEQGSLLGAAGIATKRG